MNNQNITASVKLKKTTELLQESWRIYRSKIKTLLGIMTVLVMFNIFSEALINYLNNSDIKYSILFSIILATISLASLFLWFLTIPSLIFAIKEDIGIKESFGKGLNILISYIWVYFLVSALILGGFIFLVIPGILFSVWFILAVFVLIFEERKGMSTVLKSKFLVKGNFWKVLLRFLVVEIVIFIVPLLILILIDSLYINGTIIILIKNSLRFLVNYSLELFTIPFTLIYAYLIYKDLNEIKREVHYEEPRLGRKLKYVLPGILGTFTILLLVVVSTLNIIWGRDERPTDDSYLQLSKIEISNEEENAFYWLSPWIGNYNDLSGKSRKDDLVSKYWPEGKERMKEEKEIYFPNDKSKLIDDMVAGETWDEEFAIKLLENNKEIFDDFDKAANSLYFQDPVLKNPNNISPYMRFFPIQQYRNIVKLDLIKSSDLFNQGQEKEAFNEAVKTVQLGNLMKNSQGSLINYLTATAIKEMGLNQIRAMLPKTNLQPEDLKNYIRQLEGLKDNGQGLAKAMKVEYISYNYFKKIIDMAFEGKLSEKDLESLEMESGNFNSLQIGATQRLSYLYKPNQTQRFNIEDAKLRVNNATEEYYKDMDFNEENITRVYSQINSMGPAIIFTDNPIGKTFYSIGTVSLSSAFSKKIHENFSIAGTQTLIALKMYKNEKGDLPESLDDLIPIYLSEAPRDYFDGKQVRYSKENNIIYSVGQDLKDSKGKSNTDFGDKRMDDIYYEISF